MKKNTKRKKSVSSTKQRHFFTATAEIGKEIKSERRKEFRREKGQER
jgi:parvulin-like peptidyl-prolyl isomerase